MFEVDGKERSEAQRVGSEKDMQGFTASWSGGRWWREVTCRVGGGVDFLEGQREASRHLHAPAVLGAAPAAAGTPERGGRPRHSRYRCPAGTWRQKNHVHPPLAAAARVT